MISDDFNVWFITKLIKNSKLSEINKKYDLRDFFEDCWNTARNEIIESDNFISKDSEEYCDIQNYEELKCNYEELEWQFKVLEEDISQREATIQSLLSKICYLESLVKDK